MKSIDITIPVLNEERTLKEQILKILDYMNKSQIKQFKIIIADNGSTDNTSYIAKDLAMKYEKIKYLKINKKGVGLALRTSWLESNADIVGYMDLDLSTDINHLKEVYEKFLLKDILVVNGSRLLKDSKVSNRTLLREITSRSFNFLLKSMLRIEFTDGMCGFKFFDRKTAVNAIKNGIDTDGWFFSTEILTKLYWDKIEINEIPVIWTDDPNSKVKIGKLSIEYFRNILRLRKEKVKWIKRLK